MIMQRALCFSICLGTEMKEHYFHLFFSKSCIILGAIKLQQSHLEQAIEIENIFHFA